MARKGPAEKTFLLIRESTENTDLCLVLLQESSVAAEIGMAVLMTICAGENDGL